MRKSRPEPTSFLKTKADGTLPSRALPLCTAWVGATWLKPDVKAVLARLGMTEVKFNAILAKQMLDVDKRARAQ